MTKVFLISPDERGMLVNAGDRFPLGVLYLSTVLTANRIENEVFDLNYYPKENLLKRIQKEKPSHVGLSVTSSPCFNQMKRIGEEIKRISPYIKIIGGGAHISAMPNSLEDLTCASIVGYGEEAILEALNGTEGIIKKSVDINKFPIPDRSKLAHNDYVMHFKGFRMATMVTSRGCPFDCFFCASHERAIQFRDSSNIREELTELKESNYNAVYLLDENFLVKRAHFEKVGENMFNEDMKYKVELRTSEVTQDIADYLGDTGCIEVALGIESGNDGVLKQANKKTNVEMNRIALEYLHKAKIPVKGFFIIGLPGETYNTAMDTINFAEEMRRGGMLDKSDFYALTPFPGSRLWDSPEKYGITILSRNFDNYLQKEEPVIETEGLSNSQIKQLLSEVRARWRE